MSHELVRNRFERGMPIRLSERGVSFHIRTPKGSPSKINWTERRGSLASAEVHEENCRPLGRQRRAAKRRIASRVFRARRLAPDVLSSHSGSFDLSQPQRLARGANVAPMRARVENDRVDRPASKNPGKKGCG